MWEGTKGKEIEIGNLVTKKRAKKEKRCPCPR